MKNLSMKLFEVEISAYDTENESEVTGWDSVSVVAATAEEAVKKASRKFSKKQNWPEFLGGVKYVRTIDIG
jgi:hypothetical protein